MSLLTFAEKTVEMAENAVLASKSILVGCECPARVGAGGSNNL